MSASRAVYNDPDVLVELLDLTRRNVPRSDICRRLRISQATYYKMQRYIRTIRENGPPATCSAP